MDGKSAAYTGACRVWEWDERIYASSEVIVVLEWSANERRRVTYGECQIT